MILEGGSVISDGAGTILTTEQCLLAPNRNPSLSRGAIEELLAEYLGAERIVWLGQGLVEDRDTDGHVDLIAAFTPDRQRARCRPSRTDNPNHARCEENLERLGGRRARDDRDARTSPTPRSRASTVAVGYLNFYVCNGAVIVPVTGIEFDDEALAIIADAFPGRSVVPVPGATIAYGGGGPALHHPAGARDHDANTSLQVADCGPWTRRRAPARPRARRCESDSCSSAGTPIRPSTSRRWRRASRWPRPQGARVVCLQELTLSPYFAITPDGPPPWASRPSRSTDGPTITFARRAAADSGVYVHASLFEQADRGDGLRLQHRDPRCSRRDDWSQRTRKLHIPVTAGYYEDRYFRQGPARRG